MKRHDPSTHEVYKKILKTKLIKIGILKQKIEISCRPWDGLLVTRSPEKLGKVPATLTSSIFSQQTDKKNTNKKTTMKAVQRKRVLNSSCICSRSSKFLAFISLQIMPSLTIPICKTFQSHNYSSNYKHSSPKQYTRSP